MSSLVVADQYGSRRSIKPQRQVGLARTRFFHRSEARPQQREGGGVHGCPDHRRLWSSSRLFGRRISTQAPDCRAGPIQNHGSCPDGLLSMVLGVGQSQPAMLSERFAIGTVRVEALENCSRCCRARTPGSWSATWMTISSHPGCQYFHQTRHRRKETALSSRFAEHAFEPTRRRPSLSQHLLLAVRRQYPHPDWKPVVRETGRATAPASLPDINGFKLGPRPVSAIDSRGNRRYR